MTKVCRPAHLARAARPRAHGGGGTARFSWPAPTLSSPILARPLRKTRSSPPLLAAMRWVQCLMPVWRFLWWASCCGRDRRVLCYATQVAEMAAQVFITNDKVNVVGLIVAGSAEFKTVLIEAERFDQRLAAKVMMVCDVSYGGENGLNQAIEQSADVLSNVKFVQEKKVIKKYFDEIAQDTGKICFGIDDTMKCLESSAVETLMVWENLEYWRLEVRNPTTGTDEVLVLSPAQLKEPKHFRDEENQCDKEIVEKVELVEWLSTNYTQFGCKLEIVSNKSQEGSQFCKGFGGMGGFLRYRCDFLEQDVFEGLETSGSPVPSSSSEYDDDLDLDDFM